MIISVYHECEGGLDKSIPKITVWYMYHKDCQVMTNVDH